MQVPPRVFVPFFIASLMLTLTWGATLGMINLARLTAGWGLGTLPRTSVWAHAYVQVFGFMALFIMGVAYHVLPRFVGGTLQHVRLVRWSFWLQLLGVVVIACGFFHGAGLTRPLWIAGGVSLMSAAVCFAIVVFTTMASGVPAREPFRRWIAAGACWLVVSSALVLVAAVADDVTWHRALWTAALFGFITSWIFGVGRRILPIFLGCRPRWPHLERAVFIAFQAGAAAWTIGAWPADGRFLLDTVRVAGAVLVVASVVAYTACLGLFAQIGPVLGCAIRGRAEASGASGPRDAEARTGGQGPPASRIDGWQRYVFAAWSWLFASLALGPLAAIAGPFTGGSESPLVADFARHAMAFGFAAQMVVGVASRIVPNFTGKPLWSPRARDAAFYLLNASLVIRALEVPIGMGLWTGRWNDIAWSGPPAVLAMMLFTLNIVMTVRQPQSAPAMPTVPAHVLQPVPAGRGQS
jgi:hypothetical protein